MPRREPNPPTSAAGREVPLGLEEVEALLLTGSRELAKRPEAITTLLARMAATIKEQRRRAAAQQEELERVLRESGERRHPMQRALEALGELTADEQHQILDRNYLAAMAELERERNDAQLARTVARNDINRVRLLLGQLLDEDLSPQARAQITELLETLRI